MAFDSVRSRSRSLWWLSIPAMIAMGSVSWALLRDKESCTGHGSDAVVCSNTGWLNITVAIGGLVLALVLAMTIRRIINRRT